MSENQSREQLICIGSAINMELPAVSEETERETKEERGSGSFAFHSYEITCGQEA